MREQVHDTMTRLDKGPMGPPPCLTGIAGGVAETVATWPGITASVHWHLVHRDKVDGVDFYVGDTELGHLHLDGMIHLATPPSLGRALIAQGQAQRFAYARGWVEARTNAIGTEAAVALFRRNYDRIVNGV